MPTSAVCSEVYDVQEVGGRWAILIFVARFGGLDWTKRILCCRRKGVSSDRVFECREQPNVLPLGPPQRGGGHKDELESVADRALALANACVAATWASRSAVSGGICSRCTLFTEVADFRRSSRRGLVLFRLCMSIYNGQLTTNHPWTNGGLLQGEERVGTN